MGVFDGSFFPRRIIHRQWSFPIVYSIASGLKSCHFGSVLFWVLHAEFTIPLQTLEEEKERQDLQKNWHGIELYEKKKEKQLLKSPLNRFMPRF